MYSPRQTPCQMAWLAVTLRREIYRHAPALPDNNQVIHLLYSNKFVKLNWLAEREHFRKSTSSNQTELNHTKPNSSIPN